jgi:hypothetical protein
VFRGVRALSPCRPRRARVWGQDKLDEPFREGRVSQLYPQGAPTRAPTRKWRHGHGDTATTGGLNSGGAAPGVGGVARPVAAPMRRVFGGRASEYSTVQGVFGGRASEYSTVQGVFGGRASEYSTAQGVFGGRRLE